VAVTAVAFLDPFGCGMLVDGHWLGAATCALWEGWEESEEKERECWNWRENLSPTLANLDRLSLESERKQERGCCLVGTFSLAPHGTRILEKREKRKYITPVRGVELLMRFN